jgi:RimJ/RimL family protein N-acetyltransferase
MLDKSMHEELIAAYLAFKPRNSFQGLPPLKDQGCINWVCDMITTGVNLLAVRPSEGIVGHAAVFPINERRCEMLVVVWPDYQNIGIGTELSRGCVEIAMELGFEQMWLPVESTNLRARHIYAKCGFEYCSSKLARELEMTCELNRYRPDNLPTGVPIEALGLSSLAFDENLAVSLMSE